MAVMQLFSMLFKVVSCFQVGLGHQGQRWQTEPAVPKTQGKNEPENFMQWSGCVWREAVARGMPPGCHRESPPFTSR